MFARLRLHVENMPVCKAEVRVQDRGGWLKLVVVVELLLDICVQSEWILLVEGCGALPPFPLRLPL